MSVWTVTLKSGKKITHCNECGSEIILKGVGDLGMKKALVHEEGCPNVKESVDA